MMKHTKHYVGFILVIFLMSALVACGSASTAQDGTQEKGAAAVSSTLSQEEILPEPDPKATAEGLMGEWKDIKSPERFLEIVKSEEGYVCEDNEGKYEAVFEEGVLKVTVSGSDMAEIYLDQKTGRLISIYQTSIAEYEKK